MKNKTFNPESSVYREEIVPGIGRVILRLVHTPGVGFNASEAFIRVERRIEEGSVTRHQSAYKEIFNEWYNVSMEVHTSPSWYDDVDDEGYVIYHGWANLVKNWRYSEQLRILNKFVSELKTNREHRTR